ncbi:Cytochrome P450, E-class, group IV [Trema orientale]|uniref:Cytochrome P450, E-class, group IV n=1 Tax=Trema orientale TaxID=63057 RepID=A0A2P5DFU6_TREOI|nr:Cytochrome P450, E-class, group IV [Trema orientale]
MLSFLFSLLRKSLVISINNSNSYGPLSYPIIGCLISFYENRRRLLDWYTDLLSCSPSKTIVVHRLGAPRTVVTANPTNVEYVLKTNFANFPKGKPFTEILGDLLGCGIFNVDGESWSTQRKLASHEFTTRSLREFVVKTLEEEVRDRLIPLLEEAAQHDTVLDLQEVLKRFAFDTICKVSLGHDPRCLDVSRPVPSLVRAFESAAEISAKRGTAPVFLIWKVKRLFRVGSEKKLREELGLIRGSVSEIIRNKRKLLEDTKCEKEGGGGGGGDLLSRLLLAGHEEEVVRDMVISFIMAGRDTTSAAMTWLFWLLSENRGAEKLVLDEIRKHDTGKTNNIVLSYEALQEMNFLKACLCESMRLYPPVPWDSKHAGNDDVLPDGTFVRKGDRVTYFPYGMGRMEELWGKDCLEFKPDRWFDEPGDQANWALMKPVSPFKFPVFQAGPRVCLGKEMAFTQMKYVVASVLSRFEIRPVSLDRPAFVPLLTAHMAGGLRVSVRKREAASNR